ncbi:MAG TPA: ATP-binding protein, partial [Flavobacteriales bacterium]|nr:ATP-binding protein [Flavobacteriales bacterium]
MSLQRHLQIASRMEGITEVEGLINELSEELGVDETHYGEILIAMTEAVNNAIVHGNKLDINKMV